jgi:processive 1,2-diacylglycerol beta-glucosyltransferase
MGHQRAAQALAQAFEQLPGVGTTVADTLDHARPLFRRTYASLYLRVADRAPTFWSMYYAHTDRPPVPGSVFEGMRALSTGAGVDGLPALLERERPDAIVATHFLPVEALSRLRAHGLPPIALVLTDYHAHQFWAIDGVDRYFVPTAATREQLAARGIPRAKIAVAGIPIKSRATAPADRLEARRRLGLSPWQPVVTLLGSGLPVARVRAIVEELLARRLPATLLVAAGRNHALAARLAALERFENLDVRVFGPLPSLDPLFAVSDLAIGKAGGLTVSELLAHGLPLIIPTPVPGQERWNAEYVARAGAGFGIASSREIARATVALLGDTARRAEMARAALAASRPGAAESIAGHVLDDLAHFRPHPQPSIGAEAWAL